MFWPWPDHQVVEELVGDLGTVQQVDVVARSLTADVGQRTCLLERIAARATRRENDGVTELCQGQEIPSVEGKLHDLAVLDDVADFSGIRLQYRSVDADRDVFSDTFDAEPELHVQGPTHLQHDPFLSLRREACQRRRNIPLAGSQGWKKVASPGIGHPLDEHASGGMPGCDCRSREHTARDVLDDAGNLTGIRLADRVRTRRKDECDQMDNAGRHQSGSALPTIQQSHFPSVPRLPVLLAPGP
jgi:hypothetical protein